MTLSMHRNVMGESTTSMQELSSAGAIRDADPVTKAAHVQRLQGMAEEIKAMMGALNGNKNDRDKNSGRRENDENEEDLP